MDRCGDGFSVISLTDLRSLRSTMFYPLHYKFFLEFPKACSILGPVLFLVYMNNLPAVTTIPKPLLFVDETNYFNQVSSTYGSSHCSMIWTLLLIGVFSDLYRFNTSKFEVYI